MSIDSSSLGLPPGKLEEWIIGNKTTTLEVMGTYDFDFLQCGRLLKNLTVRIRCDNIAVVYGLLIGRSKDDVWASMFFSAIIYVTCLECKIIAEHCPRLSSNPAAIVDLLSRDDIQGREMVIRLRVPVTSCWPKSMVSLMINPTYNEDFKQELLDDYRDFILYPGRLVFGHYLFLLTY